MLKVGGWLRQAVSLRIAGYGAIVLVVAVTFFWRLGSLTPGLAPNELAARQASASLGNLGQNPVNAPLKILRHFIYSLDHTAFGSRLGSVIAACLLAFCFYKLATKWFGRLIGLFGSLMFLFLPLFIISGRQASDQIMLFAPVALIWLYAWLAQSAKRPLIAWLSLLAAAGVLIYSPGLIWWLAIGAVICRQKLIGWFNSLNRPIAIASLAGLSLLILPLIIISASHPTVIKQLLLLPAHWAPVGQTLKNIAWMVGALIYKTPAHNPLIIDRLPLLNLIFIALFVFGVFAMQIAAKTKLYWLSGSILGAVLAAGLSNQVLYLALALPSIGIIASAGLRYLYIEWRSIFPLNPVPKTFAVLLICLVTTAQVYFGWRYALMAWPHSPATHSLYVLK